MSESVDTTAAAAWEDSRCPECGCVEHKEDCSHVAKAKAEKPAKAKAE